MHRAKLDAKRIYWGVEEIDKLAPFDEKTGEGDFEVPTDCDLHAGAYRLDPPDADHKAWHFQPLEHQQRPAAPAVPAFDAALYGFINKGADHPDVQAWLKYYESTLDARK